MYYRNEIENPNSMMIKDVMSELDREFSEISFNSEDLSSGVYKYILEVEDHGEMELYVDEDENRAYILLLGAEDEAIVDLNSLSRLDFSIWPSDDQYRIGTSREKSMDFEL